MWLENSSSGLTDSPENLNIISQMKLSKYFLFDFYTMCVSHSPVCYLVICFLPFAITTLHCIPEVWRKHTASNNTISQSKTRYPISILTTDSTNITIPRFLYFLKMSNKKKIIKWNATYNFSKEECLQGVELNVRCCWQVVTCWRIVIKLGRNKNKMRLWGLCLVTLWMN